MKPLTSRNNTLSVAATDPKKADAPERTPRMILELRPGLPFSLRKALPAPVPKLAAIEVGFVTGAGKAADAACGRLLSLFHIKPAPAPSAPPTDPLPGLRTSLIHLL